MSRGPQTLKQANLTKALKAAANAGIPIQSFKVAPDGEITVNVGKAGEAPKDANPWDA